MARPEAASRATIDDLYRVDGKAELIDGAIFDGAPTFAVEVRSEGDYGPAAERAMRAKRADYFAAGTLAVWDMDLLDPVCTVRLYLADEPDAPIVFARDAVAHAGDAVPGWSMRVATLFVEG